MTEQASYSLGKHWFVARTNIKCENRAQLGLEARGYRTYCPKLKKWVSHARIRTVAERPLIPRHLFVEIDPSRDGFGGVRAVDGIESLLGICGTPVVVPRRFVEEFLSRQMQGEWDYVSKDEEGNVRPLRDGCKVSVVSGEHDGFFGIIQSAKIRNGRLLVKILETAILAKLSVEMVRAA